MKHISRRFNLIILFSITILLITDDVFAGGPWVLGKGQSTLTLGFSKKVGTTRWSQIWTNPDGSPPDKNYSDDVYTFELTDPHDSTTVDGKFHDFRYWYFQGAFGICKNLELDFTINYLIGREAQRSDPYTGKLHTYTDSEGNPVIGENGTYHYAVWEINRGMTDSWAGLKYQFLHGAWPMAFEVNTRFPDLYNEPTEEYTRFHYQYITQTVVDGDTSYTVKDTIVEPGSEWRGLLKRDFAGIIHIGHSFFKDGSLYAQAFVGYNIRQGAYADQLLAAINAGYTWKAAQNINIIPSLSLDYVGGVGNGGQPDFTDRFYSVYKNNNFNNSKHLRIYASVDAMVFNTFDLKLGYGDWLWGQGEVNYTEVFAQLTYMFGGEHANKTAVPKGSVY